MKQHPLTLSSSHLTKEMLGIAPSKFFVVMSHIDDGDEPQLYNHIFTNKREANTLLRWLVRTDEERNITDYDYEVLTLAEAFVTPMARLAKERIG